MRVETREPSGSDLRARVDGQLPAGEVRRDGAELLVGSFDLPDGDGLRAAAAAAARSLRKDGGALAWRAETADDLRSLVEGSAYGAYDAGLYKRDRTGRPELTLVVDAPAELHALAERQALVMRHVDAARDLVNRAPNDLTPPALAAHARAFDLPGLAVEAHGRDWIEAQGMGSFAAVAQGSVNDPQLIVLRYTPQTAVTKVVFGPVGKAITFDSGGVSLKPALRMQDLKGDMAGGAAVIEGVAAIAELGLPVEVVGVVAATENLQGSAAFRPGDVIRAANGTTIEVINTDAEGRLILADALHHAREQGATHIVDFATLTGSMARALGDLYAGWFANDEDWAATIDAATMRSGDLGTRFPLHPRYRRYLDSNFADLKNASELRDGGSVLAAMFLAEFSGEGPWAHFDMAGPGYLSRRRPDYALDEGGSGYGVRLIVELAQGLVDAA
jgi:leucyl aminopeptidase